MQCDPNVWKFSTVDGCLLSESVTQSWTRLLTRCLLAAAASTGNAGQVSADRFSDCRLQIAGVSGRCLSSCPGGGGLLVGGGGGEGGL